jgi:mono/diheme cytochrome c family protein
MSTTWTAGSTRGRGWSIRGFALTLALLAGLAGAGSAQYHGWLIPEGGQSEKSPLTADAETLERGRTLYLSHCARCHGADGRGSGPHPEFMGDLSDELRAGLNTEGVLFYKIWNGHTMQHRIQVDDMPAFRDTLTRDEVWSVVEHLKILRTPVR